MAGYSGTPLIKKIGIREGSRVGLVNAPENLIDLLGPLPADAQIVARLTNNLDVVMLFVCDEVSLRKRFATLADKLVTNGMIWIAWPKKSAKMKTNLTFEVVQRIGLDCGLVDVKICAVDDVWSGLKFVYRVKDRAARDARVGLEK